MSEVRPVPPVTLTLRPEEGRLEGSNGRYEKFLPDLDGLYRDAAAYADRLATDDGAPVYWVETTQTEDGPGGLITGISVLEPGTVGEEYAMTRGHLHAVSDRSELYVGLSGRGVMVLDSLDGREPGRRGHARQGRLRAGHWVHRSVNVGDERFATLFTYAADAGQDYAIIERAGGMRSLVVVDGAGYAVRNPDHRGYERARMIISHDLGTTGDKATLVSDEGRVVAAVTARLRHRLRPARQGRAGRRTTGGTPVCRATRELLGAGLGARPRTSRSSRSPAR